MEKATSRRKKKIHLFPSCDCSLSQPPIAGKVCKCPDMETSQKPPDTASCPPAPSHSLRHVVRCSQDQLRPPFLSSHFARSGLCPGNCRAPPGFPHPSSAFFHLSFGTRRLCVSSEASPAPNTCKLPFALGMKNKPRMGLPTPGPAPPISACKTPSSVSVPATGPFVQADSPLHSPL